MSDVLPYAHGGPPATGVLRAEVDDFRVDEVLGFEPTGSGEHAFLTIEKRGSIDAALRADMGTNVYGCDICQDVCPYNSRNVVTAVEAFQPRAGLHQPSLLRMWRQSDTELAALVAGTAMTRAPVTSLRRNIAIAIGNADAQLDAAVLADADDVDPERPSLHDAGVREAVQWARDSLAARRLT